MDINELEQEWAHDAIINPDALGEEASRIPKLHAKYYKLMIRDAMRLKKAKESYDLAERNRWMYYKGLMTRDELKQHNLPMFQIKLITKEDVDRFLNSDDELSKLRLEIALIEQKVKFIESIISSINNRNFIIRNMIEWKKFENGVGGA